MKNFLSSAFAGVLFFCFSVTSLAQVKVLVVDNEERFYLQRVPEVCKTKACPLVFVFHGGMGKPEQIEQHSGFTPLSEKEGFIVVYPEGKNKQWNDGRPGQNSGVDDLAFFDEMLKKIKSELKIKEDAVFSTGMSNGGLFSFRLACDRAGVIRAIAPVAANLPAAISEKCSPQIPISVLNIVGTKDTAVPYEGGQIAVLFRIQKRGEVLSSDKTIAKWIKINSCSKESEKKTIDSIKDDETKIHIERYFKKCKSDTKVTRITVEGGGHAWPGHKPAHRGILHKDMTTMEIDATNEIWNFFKATIK